MSKVIAFLRHPTIYAIFLGLLYSLCFILSFPPYSMWGLSLLAVIPMYALIESKGSRPIHKAIWGAIGSAPAWIWTHYWVGDVSAFGLWPLIINLCASNFLLIWIGSHLRTRYSVRSLILPICWVGIEFLRGHLVWGGYPWYFIAHPMIDSPSGILAKPARFGGVYFVSFLSAMYSFYVYQAIRERESKIRLKAGLRAGIVFTLWMGIGFAAQWSGDRQELRVENQVIDVGVIQPNIPQDNREYWTVRQRYRDWLNLEELTLLAANDPKTPEKLDLIIWPEGFVPGWTLDPVSFEIERAANLGWSLSQKDRFDVPELVDAPVQIRATQIVDNLLALQKSMDIPMIVGSVAFDNLEIVDTDEGYVYQRDSMYNSVFVLDRGKVEPVWYDKAHLTPFGEIMPLISRWEWLERTLLSFGAQGMEFALDPAKELKVIHLPLKGEDQGKSIAIAAPICFEATISSVCRKLVFNRGSRRAGLMVNVSNDGWFGDSDRGRVSHLQNARWRCIELNTPMVRCSNTGISCVIDRDGIVEPYDLIPLRSEDPKEGYLLGAVQISSGTTIYSKLGDIFGWGCFVLMCYLCVGMIFSRSDHVQNDDRIETES